MGQLCVCACVCRYVDNSSQNVFVVLPHSLNCFDTESQVRGEREIVATLKSAYRAENLRAEQINSALGH